MSSYTHSTELCQVQFELNTLADKLEDDWRTLFYLIPSDIADIDLPDGRYKKKYNGTQEQELDSYCERQRISRACQLLEEWGTSGKKEKRPQLGHLLQLLIKGNLFRAADYVAKDLLKDAPPERPSCGPAAPIDIDRVLDGELEKMLDAASYPNSTALQNGLESLTLDNNLDRPDPQKRDHVMDLGLAPGSRVSNSDNNDQSTIASRDMPRLSALLSSDEAGPSGTAPVPAVLLDGCTLSSTSDSYIYSGSLPSSSSSERSQNSQTHPSTVMGTIKENDELPNLSMFGAVASTDGGAANVPHLSALFNNSNSVDQSHSELSNSVQLPRLSVMGFSSTNSSDSATNSNLIQFSSANCLTSTVIQFPYTTLESATANFDQRPFTNCNPSAPDGRLLGVGGFGEVFLGINLTPAVSLAAVKRLFPSNYKYREKFDREREILMKYSHPNIVQLLGYCDMDQLCLVYEFLPGGTLEAALDKCRQGQLLLTSDRRINYLFGIASAIEYLHSPQVQVIHRDVTLANILLADDIAKLCDFGLVKRVDSLTATGVMGTGPYLAPESLRGTVTPAMDVYSFGVVLAAVVTGEDVLAGNSGELNGGKDLLERVTAREAELQELVDRRVPPEKCERWLQDGTNLLELAKRCLQERFHRPTAHDVRLRIGEMNRCGAGMV
ncbi:uncharacterized protein LOC131431552 [Malaya genurostris]|uniref:uncharacterized protein LOC131431552 n=1 Tax=Malaya genurostris TaxID=325434 RepID=UPI0026F3F14D|nr:uncharacterized protein LOC131431552 [Malaya genurostris]